MQIYTGTPYDEPSCLRTTNYFTPLVKYALSINDIDCFYFEFDGLGACMNADVTLVALFYDQYDQGMPILSYIIMILLILIMYC